MFTKLESIERRFHELEKLLSEPEIIRNPEHFRKYSREHSSLIPVVGKFGEYRKALSDLKGVEDLLSSDDDEMRAIAVSEKEELSAKINSFEQALRLLLIPRDPNDDKDIIIEIRAGTGGDEAALFAGDLFRMYLRYAETKGWKTEMLDSNSTGLGGYKEVIFTVSGSSVWQRFKFERGTHRVQRVPTTEASGRIHTSAVTVAVLPEAEDVDVDVRTEDLRIDTYRASGAGGQHVNKTDSAIRITHIPTGIVVACQDERSQTKNRVKAMRHLRAKILEKKIEEQQQATTNDRRQQVGSGDRSEKIRTYNFPQNRLTDHRIDFSLYRLKDVLEGDLDELIIKLVADEQQKKLTEISTQVSS